MKLHADDSTARRASIRHVIHSRLVGTQEELRQLLAKEGFAVTQATLSRDLARLGARRVALSEGGTAYEVDDMRVIEPKGAVDHLKEMITSVTDTDALVILHTIPGAASAVALAIDRDRLQEVAGTLAGDDTIFIAPTRGVTPKRLTQHLKSLWLKGGTQ